MFERSDNGYIIHDFLDWNPSKAEVDAKRETDRIRKKLPRGFRSESDGTDSGVPDGKLPDSASPAGARVPVPSRPVPSEVATDPDPEAVAKELVGDGRVSQEATPPRSRARMASTKPRTLDRPERMTPTWEPPTGWLEAKAVALEASAPVLLRHLPEFRVYWLGRQDAKACKTQRGWLQTFGGRLENLAQRGTLWGSSVSSRPENTETVFRDKIRSAYRKAGDNELKARPNP